MKATKVKTTWSFDVPTESFGRLLGREESWDFDGVSLYKELDSIDGCDRTNYDGHFGAQVIVEIDAEFDVPETHKEIARIIKKHLRRR